MNSYTVTYEAIVEADSPEEAAEKAFESMMDICTYPPLLSVRDSDGTVTEVDMAGEETYTA